MKAAASLRRRVTLTLFGAFALALLTAAVALAFFEYRAAERRARITLETLADSLAFSLVASLDFDQPAVTKGNLARLEPSRAVLGATVFRTELDGTNRHFASYQRAGITLHFPSELRPVGFYQEGDRALLVSELRNENRLSGQLLLETDISLYRRGRRESFIILGAVLLVLMIASIVLSRLLQQTVTRPIMQLAETATRVHLTSDYALRAPVIGTDEVSELATTFNEMLASISLNLTELKTADEALRASEEQYRSLIEEARDAIFTLSSDGTILGLNQAVQKITGFDRAQWIGQHFTRVLLRPESQEIVAPRFAEVLRGEYPPPFELPIRTIHNTIVILEFVISPRLHHGKVVGVLGVGRDVTERHLADEAKAKLEVQLLQSQKMEAIGTLAGGIAHDFNNILSGVTGFTSLARQAVGDNAEALDYLDEIGRAGRRAADLVRQILAFSRTGDQARVPLQLRHIVAEAAKLLRAAIPSTVEFDVNLAPDLSTVQGNATQLHQVVMNLGTNAWYAMRDRPGRLTLSLETCVVNEALTRQLSGIAPGLYVRLTVADTGCGIDETTQKRIFEPFFTTKGPGEGTGLGLSVVHGIVTGHHGAIRLTSEVGRGTTFEIYLPAIAAAEGLSREVSEAIPRGHGESILFVDDEESLVRLGVRTLVQLGYAAEGESQVLVALSRLQLEPKHFQLVITDLTMPNLTGIEFTQRIHELRADLPVVLASGYKESMTSERIQAAGVCEVLAKPYTMATLALAIRRHLPYDSAI